VFFAEGAGFPSGKGSIRSGEFFRRGFDVRSGGLFGIKSQSHSMPPKVSIGQTAGNGPDQRYIVCYPLTGWLFFMLGSLKSREKTLALYRLFVAIP
jgi:hypothetical protein